MSDNKFMTDADYELTQETLSLAAKIVGALDLDGFLARINRAETLGSILNPTLYNTAAGKLGLVRSLAIAALPLKGEVERQIKIFKKETESHSPEEPTL